MPTIEATNTTDVAAVEETLATLQNSPLAAQLQALISQIREGATVRYFAEDHEVTPNEAAHILKVSRPVVMSLIRRGEIVAHIVGVRDHRIPMKEITDYIERRDIASRELAATFARGSSTHRDAIARAAGVTAERAAELGF